MQLLLDASMHGEKKIMLPRLKLSLAIRVLYHCYVREQVSSHNNICKMCHHNSRVKEEEGGGEKSDKHNSMS